MATDITTTALPNDNPSAPDINFQNDTSMSGITPPETEPRELSDTDKELAEIDEEIITNLYRDLKPGEFVFGRNIEKGLQGINSRDLGLLIGPMSLPIAPEMSENKQDVSGMYGQRYLGTNYGAKIFEIPASILATTAEEYLSNIEQISNTLIRLGSDEIPIMFSAYPDRTYYGHFTKLPKPSFYNLGKWESSVTLEFTASDPHGYLDPEIVSVDNQNKLQITPKGNDVAKPFYHFDFKADSNNFGYTDDKGEFVFVGFAEDDNPTDLVPLVYNDPIEDTATFTRITDMSSQPWALANAQPVSDGTFNNLGYGISVDKFWTVPHDYTGNATAFGTVLQTKKFNVGANGNWKLGTRMWHNRYYDRAYQRIEAYILGTDGHKIGRMGIADYGGGGLTYIYILFGSTIAEENDNLANGFGYYDTGNTEWARAQINQQPGYSVTIKGTDNNANMSVDRQKTTKFTQVLYDTSNKNPVASHNLGTKWTRTIVTVEKWKTPRDSSGKKTAPQQYSKVEESNNLQSTSVPRTKVVNHRTQSIQYTTYQDYRVDNLVWGSAVGRTSYWSTWHNVGTPVSYGNGWKWRTTDFQHGTQVDKQNKRVNQPGAVTTQTDLGWDYNDASALTKFWGNFEVTRIDDTISIKVFRIGDGGLQTSDVVLDTSFAIPSGFDAKIGQIAYFFGKTPIHEDKITKTIPATNDTPAKWEYVRTYNDDGLGLTNLEVFGLTTVDALKKAHTIIHAGDNADIDTETENVYINGALANQYLSPASTYPLLHGNVQSNIAFQPTPDKATVSMVYRPALK